MMDFHIIVDVFCFHLEWDVKIIEISEYIKADREVHDLLLKENASNITRTEEVMDCPTCVRYTGDKPTLRIRLLLDAFTVVPKLS